MNINTKGLDQMLDALVNPEITKETLDEKEFNEKVQNFRTTIAPMIDISDEEFNEVLDNIKTRYNIRMDLGIVLEDSQEHQNWFAKRKQNSEMFLWERYKTYLQRNKNWGPNVITSLDTVTDKIVDLLGDPEREEGYSRRGLVLGDVQSGKTANYTAVCNKAADAGYKIIIVLAGTLNNLRAQTQERLDEEFVGYNSSKYLDPDGKKLKEKIGVGTIDSSKEEKVISFTSRRMDFDVNVLRSNNLGLSDLKGPVLLVVKKNKSILDNLIAWLESNNIEAGKKEKIPHPMLLIDDEADYASVDTSKTEDDPTAINQCIRKLIGWFDKSTYLAYTATPFANIFIDPYNTDTVFGEDLFPRDFIYLLEAPTNYIGADKIFGVIDDDLDVDTNNYLTDYLVPIDTKDVEKYFPFKQKKDMPVTGLPDSLKEAAGYFILVNAIQDARGNTNTHRSMMVHVSRFTNVQDSAADRLREWLLDIKSNIKNYYALPAEKAELNSSISFLKGIWDKFGLSKVADLNWDELLHKYLNMAVATITVETVNMNSARSLDFYGNREEGLRVIAVGGNSLSRGLTLEGLCVSYFYRKSLGYDTLFQMGRWFGYRSGYNDLVKIWMSQEIIRWYRTINDAIHELKDEIIEMDDLKLTPKEFGLKVKKDPESLLYVTAANKRQNTGSIKRPVTVSGRLLETPRLYYDQAILKENQTAVENFLKGVVLNGKRDTSQKDYYWRGVSQASVVQLIRLFKTHPWHLSYQGKALADYIEDNLNSAWDVALITGGEGDTYTIPGTELVIKNTEKRNITVEENSILISGSKVKVGAGGSTKIGLSKEQIEKAKEDFFERSGKKNLSDSGYLIKDRAPLLMVHVVQTDLDEQNSTLNAVVPKFVYAIGIGFPYTGEEDKTAKYVINMVEMRNYLNPDEETEDL